MQHLTPEALARLVDENAGGEEAAHLESCPGCREELDALRRQTAALAALGQAPAPEPPIEHWNAILAGLTGSAAGELPLDDLSLRRRSRFGALPWMRIAAAIALYAVGTATGLAFRSRATPAAVQAPAGGSAAVATPAGEPTTTSGAAAQVATLTPSRVEEQAPAQGEEIQPSAGAATLASNPQGRPRLHALPDATTARTPEEALAYLKEAERAYARAYTRYSELADPQMVDDPAVRIAALESIVLTTRQALDRAPADPVINGYHLTAVAQRDAALRQVALKSNAPWF